MIVQLQKLLDMRSHIDPSEKNGQTRANIALW
jgi:hypothetical protein